MWRRRRWTSAAVPRIRSLIRVGILVRTQFVLNPDFTADNSCMGINLDGVAGDEVIVGGREVTGLARGPAIQGFNSNGSIKVHPICIERGF